MDADCLIKLTKAKLKELVCNNFTVVIPLIVKKEVVDNATGHPDADIIGENIEKNLLRINNQHFSAKKGEEAVFAIYKQGGFDAICSDDKRFIKRLRMYNTPYITPSVFIAILVNNSIITIMDAHKKLILLSPFISDDEFHTVKLILDNWRHT